MSGSVTGTLLHAQAPFLLSRHELHTLDVRKEVTALLTAQRQRAMHTVLSTHRLWEGPWGDIGVVHLCNPVMHPCKPGTVYKLSMQRPIHYSPPSMPTEATERLTTSVNDRKKGSIWSEFAFFFPFPPSNISTKHNLWLAHPCFADRNSSFHELINKPNFLSMPT